MIHLFADTVVVHHHTTGSVDSEGNQSGSFATTTTYMGRLEQRSGAERVLAGDTQQAEWMLILPAGAVIDGRDRVEVDGVTFEVVGPPVRHKTPRGEHHVEASLVTSNL